jgi:hypothetical protein
MVFPLNRMDAAKATLLHKSDPEGIHCLNPS